MRGKVCMVTGANAGIGRATALGLARMGATVVMVCRNTDRGQEALAWVQQESGNSSVRLLLADLSSQASIHRLATDFKALYPALHVLINNAGIIPRRRILTEDGLETQFAVNHLAYFLLTALLLDVLKAGAPARIINVSSQLHGRAPLDFDDLQSERSYNRVLVYARTKLANVLHSYELARMLEGTGVTANCLHPGVVATNLLADATGLPRAIRFAVRVVRASPEAGARTSLYLATSLEVEGVTGKYFARQRAVPSSKASYDQPAARRLWRISEELTGLPSSG
ncbi:MAG: SDR family oxidoreductase [Chloroflexi bacterium]|nr:SDR family oxidoreductase [Chloroflexota bacterium]